MRSWLEGAFDEADEGFEMVFSMHEVTDKNRKNEWPRGAEVMSALEMSRFKSE
jgi:hypothetical protein